MEDLCEFDKFLSLLHKKNPTPSPIPLRYEIHLIVFQHLKYNNIQVKRSVESSSRSFYCKSSNYFTSCSFLLHLSYFPVWALFKPQRDRGHNIYKSIRNDRRAKILLFSSCNTQCPNVHTYRALLELKNSTLWAYYSHTGPIVYQLYKTLDPLKSSLTGWPAGAPSTQRGNMRVSLKAFLVLPHS